MNWSYQVLLPAAGQGAFTRTLAVNAGSFAISGQPPSGKISRRLIPGVGSFASAAFALLLREFTLSALPRVVAASGQGAAAVRDWRIQAGHASVEAGGQDADPNAFRRLVAAAGALATSGGSAAAHVAAGLLAAAAGGVALGGKAAVFRLARRIGGFSAAFTASLKPAVERAACGGAANSPGQGRTLGVGISLNL